MDRIINRLHGALKRVFIAAFLRGRHVDYADIPSFAGRWPIVRNKGNLRIGSHCRFRSFRLAPCISVYPGASLEVGDDCFFNDGVNISVWTSVQIGSDTKIGDMTYIYDTDFHSVSPEAPVKQSPVRIGRNVWVGANCMILAGSVIGDHAVIAAGSIVAGEIPAKTLAAGTPARPVRQLDIPDDWIRE